MYTLYDFLASCTLVECDNYITTIVNVTPNQLLLCNYCMALTHMIMTCVHFHYPLDMKLSTCLQLVSTIIPIGTSSCDTM